MAARFRFYTLKAGGYGNNPAVAYQNLKALPF